MVRPIKHGPVEPIKHPKESAHTKGISSSLASNKTVVQNFMDKGRGKSALGAGCHPTFSEKAPKTITAKVSQAVKSPLLHPKKK